jgi:hypothetical protein
MRARQEAIIINPASMVALKLRSVTFKIDVLHGIALDNEEIRPTANITGKYATTGAPGVILIDADNSTRSLMSLNIACLMYQVQRIKTKTSKGMPQIKVFLIFFASNILLISFCDLCGT